MYKTSIAIAERVLRFLTTEQRAASIVGDLIETAPRKGAGWFWFSIFKIAFWLSWRPLLAFVAAFYCGNWALGGLQLAIYGANHQPLQQWMPIFEILLATTVVLCMLLAYAIIRYGVRDRMTELGLLWTGLLNFILWEWWRPGVLPICIALAALLMVVTLHNRERRKAFAALLTTVPIGMSGWFGSMYLTSRWQHFIYAGPWGDADVRAHPSVLWIGLLTYLAVVWISIATFSRLHKWATEQKV